jgi:DNA-binding transcriptional MerR regulator
MGKYTIKQLELLSGVKAHTIRIWEKRYSLFTPQRTSTNIRRYSDTDLRMILNVATLLRNGYKISRIAKKSPEERAQLLEEATRRPTALGIDIEPLLEATITFNELALRGYIGQSATRNGLELTYEQLIHPFLDRLGSLWQSGAIHTTHEHFATNIVKHFLIEKFASLPNESLSGKPIVFFLPEGEFHEIALLYYAYVTKKGGFRVIYLGQSTPTTDVVALCKDIGPLALFTSMSTRMGRNEPKNLILAIRSAALPLPVFTIGQLFGSLDFTQLEGVLFVTNASSYLATLSNYRSE